MTYDISGTKDETDTTPSRYSIQKFIVTEGRTDSSLLKRVLGNLEQVEIKTGSGYSSALSLASSVLIYHKKPVLLMIDADSNELTEIDERDRFVRNYLETATPGAIFAVVLAEPELEAIFFQDVTVAEHLFGRPLTREELEFARSRPKQFLKDNHNQISELIGKLDSCDIAKLNQLTVFKEIQSFIQST